MRSAFRHSARCIALAIAAGWLTACGGADGDPVAQPTGPSMSAHPAGEAAVAGSRNRAPEIQDLRLVPQEAIGGEPVSAQLRVSDPDGDNVTLEYRWSLNRRELSASGSEVTVSEGRRGDRLSVSVVASDGHTRSRPATAEAEIGNSAPRLEGLSLLPSGEVRAGREIVALPIANDRDGDPIEFEFEWRVNDELVETSDAVLPTQGLARGDTIAVSVVANDGYDHSHRLSSPAIELVNAPPQIERQPIDGNENGIFQHQIAADDPDGDRLLYRLRKGPDGMTVGRTTGLIDWTPSLSQAGMHVIEIEIDDLHGAKEMYSFSLTIGDAPTPAAPQE